MPIDKTYSIIDAWAQPAFANALEKMPEIARLFNIPAKGFSTHSESSSLGGEEFGRPSPRGDYLLDTEPTYLYDPRR